MMDLLDLLEHGSSCSCARKQCRDMQTLSSHFASCNTFPCKICQDMTDLTTKHSQICKREQCPVVKCSTLKHSSVHCTSDRNNEVEIRPDGNSFTTLDTISNRERFSSEYLILPSKNPTSHHYFSASNRTTEMNMNSSINTDNNPISCDPTARKAVGNKITKAKAMKEVRKVAMLEKREDNMRRKTAASGPKKRLANSQQPFIARQFSSQGFPDDEAAEGDCHQQTRFPMASFELYDRNGVHSSPNSHHSYSSLSGTEDDHSYVSNLTGKESSESSRELLLPAQSLKNKIFFSDVFMSKQDRSCDPVKKCLCCATITNNTHASCGGHPSFSQSLNYSWQAQCPQLVSTAVSSDCGPHCATVQQQIQINPQLFLEPVNLLHNHLVYEGIAERGSKDDDDWMSSFLEAELSTRL